MFPLNLGFLGAALATALSPVVTMLVCSTHYLGKNNHVEFHWRKPLFAGSLDGASLVFLHFLLKFLPLSLRLYLTC